jgi:hypothetical protein
MIELRWIPPGRQEIGPTCPGRQAEDGQKRQCDHATADDEKIGVRERVMSATLGHGIPGSVEDRSCQNGNKSIERNGDFLKRRSSSYPRGIGIDQPLSRIGIPSMRRARSGPRGGRRIIVGPQHRTLRHSLGLPHRASEPHQGRPPLPAHVLIRRRKTTVRLFAGISTTSSSSRP